MTNAPLWLGVVFHLALGWMILAVANRSRWRWPPSIFGCYSRAAWERCLCPLAMAGQSRQRLQ